MFKEHTGLYHIDSRDLFILGLTISLITELGTVTVSPVMAVMVKSPVTKSSPVTSPVIKLSPVKLFHW